MAERALSKLLEPLAAQAEYAACEVDSENELILDEDQLLHYPSKTVTQYRKPGYGLFSIRMMTIW